MERYLSDDAMMYLVFLSDAWGGGADVGSLHFTAACVNRTQFPREPI